ncbi:hypothetical protein D3C72_1255210 [compost metagenome]
MLLRSLFGHQQEDQQRYRLAIGRFERNWFGQAHERGQRLLQALDAPVRDRHAGAQAGGAQRLAREQVVRHGGARYAMVVLEEEPGLLEHTLLAGDADVEGDVAGWQQFGQTIHGRCAGVQLAGGSAVPPGSVWLRGCRSPATPRRPAIIEQRPPRDCAAQRRPGGRPHLNRARAGCGSACMAQHTPCRGRCEHSASNGGQAFAQAPQRRRRKKAALCAACLFSLDSAALCGTTGHAHCCICAAAIWYLTASRSWPCTRSL